MKNENPTLLRKLKAYSAMAGSIIAVAGTANAQAIYTDIEPDVTVDQSGSDYLIDLNNDGNKDFAITLFQSTTGNGYLYNKVAAKPYNGSIGGSDAGDYVYASAMIGGDLIDAALEWNNDASQTMGAGFVIPASSSLYAVYGKWYGVENRYIPLRFKIGADKFYGWARLDVAGLVNSFTIKDFAYNPNANQGLVAGQGDPTGVDLVSTQQAVKIFAYDGKVNVILSNQKIENATLVITNMVGQEVKSLALTNSSTQIDVSDLAFGIYMAKVTNGSEIFTQKVALRK